MKKVNLLGLSTDQVAQKQQEYGLNEIGQEKGLPWLRLIFSQFRSPLIYVLFFFGIVSLFLREWTDAIVIFLAVAINASLAFFQEFKAEKALVALKKLIVPKALVIRNGNQELVDVSQIVPEDLVILKIGNRVPADGVLVFAKNLHLDEAILTGESRPVWKRGARKFLEKKIKELINSKVPERNAVSMGTVVVSGRGKFLVTATGKETKIGRLARKLIETSEEETPLKKQIARLAQTLTLVITLVSLAVFIEGILTGRSAIEMFSLAVAVAVASIPEGLIISLTTILALGMERISRRKGLVRKLLAAETLGSVDVICLDKTGTLTEGRARVVKVDALNKKKMIWTTICCNSLVNPVDVALWNWGKKRVKRGEVPVSCLSDGLGGLKMAAYRVSEIPFSSRRKFSAVLCKSADGHSLLSVVGAPELVLKLTSLSKEEKQIWQEKLEKYSQQGYRLVGLSFLEGEFKSLRNKFSLLKKKLTSYDEKVTGKVGRFGLNWSGLVLLEDPLRLEVKSALKLAGKAGITIKVITGDYRTTAETVLKRLALVKKSGLNPDQVFEGKELEIFSDQELREKIDQAILFCRTTPNQKIKIVSAFQENGHVVAMMGDGVNDALALKKADIGVVVGDATEVAKETADMVLLDSRFSTVVAAIEEGRTIFENIKKVVLYLLSSSFSELILIGGSLLLGLPIPVLPAQILWVNLVEDSLPGLAMAFEKGSGDNLMKGKPRKKDAPILDKKLKTSILIVGGVTDLLLFGFYFYLWKAGFPLGEIRTIIFASLAVDSLLFSFSCKSLKRNIWKIKIFDNLFLVGAVTLGFIALLVGVYSPFFNLILKTTPLSLNVWGLVFVLGVVDVVVIEVLKLAFKIKK